MNHKLFEYTNRFIKLEWTAELFARLAKNNSFYLVFSELFLRRHPSMAGRLSRTCTLRIQSECVGHYTRGELISNVEK